MRPKSQAGTGASVPDERSNGSCQNAPTLPRQGIDPQLTFFDPGDEALGFLIRLFQLFDAQACILMVRAG